MSVHVLEIPISSVTMQDLIDQSKVLVRELHVMQLSYHIKSTKSSIRKNEALWEEVASAGKDKKQNRCH